MLLENETTKFILSAESVAEEVSKTLETFANIQPDWESLSYTSNGIGELYEEIKRIGSYASSLFEIISRLRHRRNIVDHWLRGQQAQLEREVKLELQKNIKTWQRDGYSYQERQMLAELAVGDSMFLLRKVEAAVNTADQALTLLVAKHKDYNDFLYRTSTLENVLRLGVSLKEIAL